MSEQVQNPNQQTIVIGLLVIAALLAAIVGVLVYQQSQANSIPAPSAQGTAPQASGDQMPPSGMGSQPAADFDPSQATKVPAGTEPEAFVKDYYEACDKGDWQAAFDALPTAKKAGNSPEALKEQVSGYGIKSFKVTNATVEGDKATVIVDQETGQYGTFENTWTFVKKDGAWLVESKAVTGMR
jgi:cell division protein FtsN